MATEHRLPPSASTLLDSMRDLGYSFEAAVADLIDNSISANATKIDIVCDLTENPSLSIIDNGTGMSCDELIDAMRHGSQNKHQRHKHDLGRFGLGLKTASFSQCRQFTVTSMKNCETSSAEWNLDVVKKEDDWLISILNNDEIKELPYIDKLIENGTIVLWRNMDRLFEDETGMRRDEIVNEKLDVLEKHMSLVFHRFLSGEIKGRKKLEISINGHCVNGFDPFCRNNTATQLLPEEIIRIDDSIVRLTPYILPHHSKLSAVEYDYYQSRSDFLSNQGAYIYRNNRLLAWGDWFRLIPKGEATKLARVQIDFPSSLDAKWTIDIKKSRAKPPYQVRERLRQVILKISERSTIVHRNRGKKLFDEIKTPVWERYADRDSIRYSLNRQHPIIQSVYFELPETAVKKLDMLIDTVEASLPIEMIYSDYSSHPHEIQKTNAGNDSVFERLAGIKESLYGSEQVSSDDFRAIILSTHLFDEHLDELEKFLTRECK